MEYTPTLQAGEIILDNKYRIESLIGRSEFAEVYRATSIATNRLCAIKIVGWDMVGMNSKLFNVYRARFRRDVQLGSQLKSHPHVTPVYDFEESAARLFLIMEFAPGGSLQDRLRQGPLPMLEAIQITLAIANGLSSLHHLGEVHCNVKPSNILFDASGQAQISDLGSAQMIGSQARRMPEYSETSRQTDAPKYMSPEQANENGLLMPTSDVYSLGCVLFEMLTGAGPQNANQSIHCVRQLNPTIPPALDQVVMRMLSTIPSRGTKDAAGANSRYPTMRDVREALQSAMGQRIEGKRKWLMVVIAVSLAALVLCLSALALFVHAPIAPPGVSSIATVAPSSVKPPEQRSDTFVSPTAGRLSLSSSNTPIPPGGILKPFIFTLVTAGLPPILPTTTSMKTPIPPTQAATPTSSRFTQATGTSAQPMPASTPEPILHGKTWAENAQQLTELTHRSTSRINSIACSPNSTVLIGASSTGINLYDLQTLQEIKRIETRSPVYNVAFSPDGATMASGFSDGIIELRQVSDGALLLTLIGHTNAVMSVAFSPDGATLASGAIDRTVRLWRVSDGALLHTLEGHTSWVSSVAFSPDGAILASGARDKTVQLWLASNGTLLRTLEGHTSWVSSVAFSPDGTTLASGAGDKTVRLWSVRSGTLLRSLETHPAWVSSVSFSPDGTILASGDWAGTVRLWQASDGVLLNTLRAHTNVVTSIIFPRNSAALLSAAWDGTIRSWGIPQFEPD